MNFPIEMGVLVGAVLIFCSILISKAGYRFGVPTLLMFLIAGMFFGTDGLGMQFDNAQQAQNIGMIALCVILFTGGMDTKIGDIRPVMAPGLVLSTLGVLLTTVFTGLFAYSIAGLEGTKMSFSLLGAMLLAATMSSTDSASVFNILRSQKINLKYNLRPMLELESGSNDPMAYLLTIILIQCIQMGGASAGDVALSFVLQFAVGILGGFLLGKAAVWVINRVHLSNTELYSIMVLSFIFIIYSTVFLLKGNGYLAIYIAGMVMGNSKLFKKNEITTFLDGMTWLFQIVIFLVLGLLVNPHEMLEAPFCAVLVALFMTLVARPLSVYISLLPFGKRITNKSKLFISWVGLRGAAPIIFATYPVVAGVEGASQIFNIVFFVTLFSLLFQGMSLSKVARKLDLTEPYDDRKMNFGIELPDDVAGALHEVTCTKQMLANGHQLKDLSFEKGALVMLIKRDEEYIVPNGSVELEPGDVFLVITDKDGKVHI